MENKIIDENTEEKITVERHYSGALHVISSHQSGTIAVENTFDLIKTLHDSSPEMRAVMEQVVMRKPKPLSKPQAPRIRAYYAPTSTVESTIDKSAVDIIPPPIVIKEVPTQTRLRAAYVSTNINTAIDAVHIKLIERARKANAKKVA